MGENNPLGRTHFLERNYFHWLCLYETLNHKGFGMHVIKLSLQQEESIYHTGTLRREKLLMPNEYLNRDGTTRRTFPMILVIRQVFTREGVFSGILVLSWCQLQRFLPHMGVNLFVHIYKSSSFNNDVTWQWLSIPSNDQAAVFCRCNFQTKHNSRPT